MSDVESSVAERPTPLRRPGDSIGRGVLAVFVAHVLGQAAIAWALQRFMLHVMPSLGERPTRWSPLLGLSWIGASQLVYAVPLILWFEYRRRSRATLGVVIGLFITLCANGIVMAVLLDGDGA